MESMVMVPAADVPVVATETASDEEEAFTILKVEVLLKFVEERISRYLLWNSFSFVVTERYAVCFHSSFVRFCCCFVILDLLPEVICSTKESISIPETKPPIPVLASNDEVVLEFVLELTDATVITP